METQTSTTWGILVTLETCSQTRTLAPGTLFLVPCSQVRRSFWPFTERNANTKLQNRMNKESQSKLQLFVTTLPLIKQQNNTLDQYFPTQRLALLLSFSKLSQIVALFFPQKNLLQSQCSKKSTNIHLIDQLMKYILQSLCSLPSLFLPAEVDLARSLATGGSKFLLSRSSALIVNMVFTISYLAMTVEKVQNDVLSGNRLK